MADIAHVLAAYDALAGVAIGAGLTYGFGALNRRHQEAREDTTRWYEARREAYGALLIAASRVSRNLMDAPGKPERPTSELMDEMTAAMGAVRLVGSPRALAAADNLFTAIVKDVESRGQKLLEIGRRKAEGPDVDLDRLEEELENSPRAVNMPAARKTFEEIARADLGHPSPKT